MTTTKRAPLTFNTDKIVPPAVAREMAYTGDRVGAGNADRAGRKHGCTSR